VRSGKFKFGSDVQEALQAGPWLVEKGAPVAGLDDTRSARRTIVANDGKGQWALLATSSITLADASRLLCAQGIIGPLKIANALNLDGGSSIAFQAGLAPEILIDLRSLGPVRNYLTIAPRRP
jgi:exopolysaccharide biosynthesis protein